MLVLDDDLRVIFARKSFHTDIQVIFALGIVRGAESGGGEGAGFGDVLLRDGQQHPIPQGRVPADAAEGRGDFDAARAARVGDDDALHVLDDIAAQVTVDPLGHLPQGLPRFGRRKSDSDGFCAAQGGHEFMTEDVKIL